GVAVGTAPGHRMAARLQEARLDAQCTRLHNAPRVDVLAAVPVAEGLLAVHDQDSGARTCHYRSEPRAANAPADHCDGGHPTSELARIDAHDFVEATEADVERSVGYQLDQLGLGEVRPHLRPEGVVDLLVIHRKLLGELERRALARPQEGRGL